MASYMPANLRSGALLERWGSSRRDTLLGTI
jgi:hypothetical protein